MAGATVEVILELSRFLVQTAKFTCILNVLMPISITSSSSNPETMMWLASLTTQAAEGSTLSDKRTHSTPFPLLPRAPMFQYHSSTTTTIKSTSACGIMSMSLPTSSSSFWPFWGPFCSSGWSSWECASSRKWTIQARWSTLEGVTASAGTWAMKTPFQQNRYNLTSPLSWPKTCLPKNRALLWTSITTTTMRTMLIGTVWFVFARWVPTRW